MKKPENFFEEIRDLLERVQPEEARNLMRNIYTENPSLDQRAVMEEAINLSYDEIMCSLLGIDYTNPFPMHLKLAATYIVLYRESIRNQSIESLMTEIRHS